MAACVKTSASLKKVLQDQLGINLTVVDASEEFLADLKDIHDLEKKRKFISGKFIDVFEEVCELGRQLSISPELVGRHSFPAPGLAIRVLGEVTEGKVEMARKADHIFISMIREAGLCNESVRPTPPWTRRGPSESWATSASMPTSSYSAPISTRDFMTASPYPSSYEFLVKVSTRIVNEVEGVCRVAYDYTSKPPGTIEMEYIS